jgi:Ni/Co efflux regulator RcnB
MKMKSRIAVLGASLAALSFAALPVAGAAAATTHHDLSRDRTKVERTSRDRSSDHGSRDNSRDHSSRDNSRDARDS